MKFRTTRCLCLGAILLAGVLMVFPSQKIWFGPEQNQFFRASYFHYEEQGTMESVPGGAAFFAMSVWYLPWLRAAWFSVAWLLTKALHMVLRRRATAYLRFDYMADLLLTAVLGGVASVSALTCAKEAPALLTTAVAALLTLSLIGQLLVDWLEYRGQRGN